MVAVTFEYRNDRWWYWFFYEGEHDRHGPFASFKEATANANDQWYITRMPSDLVV